MTNRLARLLNPVTTDAFLECYQTRRHLHIRRNEDGFYNDMGVLEGLDSYFESETSSAAFVNVVAAGERQPLEKWSVEMKSERGTSRAILPGQVLNLFLEKNTIVLNHASDRIAGLGGTCRELTADFGFRVQANIYITAADSQGFARHVDAHDVIVLQIYGSKSWVIQAPETGQLDIQVEPGDLLYLPAGIPHEARSSARASIHVTLGLHANYGYRLIEELARVAAGDPELQQPAPPAWAPALMKAEFAAALQGRLKSLVSRTRVEMLLANETRKLAEKQGQGWPERFSDVLRLEAITPLSVVCARAGAIFSIEESATELVVIFGSSRIAVPKFVHSALERILCAEPFVIGDLQGLMSGPGKVGLVKPFVRYGLVAIVRI